MILKKYTSLNFHKKINKTFKMNNQPQQSQQQSQQSQQQPQQINFEKLIDSFKQITENMNSEEQQNIEPSKMFDKVYDTVFSSMDQMGIEPSTKSQLKVLTKHLFNQVSDNIPDNKPSMIDIDDDNNTFNHKIPVKNDRIEEIGPDEYIEDLRPYMDDIHYNLPCSLEDLYKGTTKKLAVERYRIDVNKKNVSRKEKRKIEVPIPKGSKDGQEIRFNKEGDEKPGYESGDIVITLCQKNHSHFERRNGDLFITKKISLFESYAVPLGLIKIVIEHIDGSYFILNTNNNLPLHANDGGRKIKNGGMPIPPRKNEKLSYGDLYIRFDLVLPENFESKEALIEISKLFPILDKNNIVFTNKENKGGFNPIGLKTREVQLEEITEEDMEQLDYESEYSDDDDSEDSEDDN